ncbi:MAG: PKD domain-containing protein [Herpetosiphonaceae bacterium]|nr:PKD domain-containing protein [Herpetosiphonaceae bacterium]
MSSTTPLTYSIQILPSHGSATLRDQVVIYTPTLNFSGTDRLDYTITSPQQTYVGRVNLVVKPVNDDPTVTISAQPTAGAAPLSVAFSAAASDVDADQLTAEWDFGDGTTPTNGWLPTHIYTSTGTFTATVIVSDAQGGAATAHQLIQVTSGGTNLPPLVTLTAQPATGRAPLLVALVTTASDPNLDPLTYTLDFGDGLSTQGIVAHTPFTTSHEYTSNGTYLARITVGDGHQGVTTRQQTIIVSDTPAENLPPTVALSAQPASGQAPFSTTLTFTAADPDSDPLTYTLDLGDGTWISGDLLTASFLYAHTYTSTGSFSAQVVVGDGHGATATDQITITVVAPANTAPAATLAATPASGSAPLTTTLSITASDADADPLTYTLDFGDGTSQHGPISQTLAIQHVYHHSATYSALLRVFDGRGGSASATSVIQVGAHSNGAPVAYGATIILRDASSGSIDLAAFSADPDGDSLSLTISEPAAQGVTGLNGTILTYTRNNGYRGPDQLRYRVDDGRGGSAVALVSIVDQRVTFQVEPASVLLTSPAMTQTLRVVAYDSQGREIDPAGIQFEWMIVQSSWLTATAVVSFTQISPREIVVRGNGMVGSALISARNRDIPAMQAPLVPVVVADLVPGAIPLADSAVIYPPTGVPPHIDPLTRYPLDSAGHLVIGDFTEADLLPLYQTFDHTEAISATFPIVVRGAAPPVGSLLVGMGGSQILGRVRAITSRGDSTLVQLETLALDQVFHNLDLYLSLDRLAESGITSSYPISTYLKLETAAKGNTAQLRLVTGLDDADAAPLATCVAKTAGQWGHMIIGAATLTPHTRMEAGLRISAGEIQAGRFLAGAQPQLTWSSFDLLAAAQGIGGFECVAAEAPAAIELPTTLPAFFHLTPRPQVKLALGLAGRMEIDGQPGLRLTVQGGNGSGDLAAGFSFQRVNTTLAVRDLSTWQASLGALNVAASMPEIPADVRWRVDSSLSWRLDGAVAIEQLGGLFDVLHNPGLSAQFPAITARHQTLIAAVTDTTLEAQSQLGWRTRWASSDEVVWSNILDPDDRKFVPLGQTQTEQTGTLHPAGLTEVLRSLGVATAATFDLPAAASATTDLYQALDRASISLSLNGAPTSEIWVGDQIRVTAALSANLAYPLTGARLYYLDDEDIDFTIRPVAELAVVGGQLVGTLIPDAEMCNLADKEISFHLVGFNRMYAELTASSYLGQLQATCNELKLEITLPSVLANTPFRDSYGAPLIWACDVVTDPLDLLTLAVSAQAMDSQGNLAEMVLFFSDETVVVTGTGGVLTAALSHEFRSGSAERQLIWVEARAGLPNAQGQYPRVRRVEVPFTLRYRTCDTLERRDTRTRETLCERILEENIFSGHWEYPDPDSSVGVIVWDSSSGWRAYERISKGTCYWKVENDPHISTMDGRRFDSFALGEFQYLGPRPGFEHGGVTVQARHEQITNTLLITDTIQTAEWAAWNTTFAIELDGMIFEFRAGTLNRPLINHLAMSELRPGVYSFGEVDLKVNSPTVIEISYRQYRLRIDEMYGKWLNLEALVPQDDTHIGMMGRPNGLIADDTAMPDGTLAFDDFDLANGWRITETAKSLFTYDLGEGPWSYNKRQDWEPPSRTELAPYMEQATILLQNTCDASNLDEIAIRNVAIELFLGRSAQQVIDSGICFYNVMGVVSNSLVPGLPVPGAKITIMSSELAACTTWTDRFGRYICRVPSNGQTGTLQVAISGRGAASEEIRITSLPPAGGIAVLEQNFAVAPTTLQLVGKLSDQTGQTLYNAELRINAQTAAGFTSVYTTTTGTGAYTTYMMLDNAIVDGTLTYRISFNPEFRTDPNALMVHAIRSRPYSGLNQNALNVVSHDLVLTGVLLAFQGRVSFLFDEARPAPGTRVLIEPVQPHPQFNSCDVTTLVYVDPKALVDEFGTVIRTIDPRKETTDRLREGTYSCEAPIEDLTPFDVRIDLVGRDPTTILTSTVVTVDPRNRGAGELFRVVTPLRLATPVLYLNGYVRGPDGQPVAGADVAVKSPQALTELTALTDVTGQYTMYLPLDDSISIGTLEYAVRYLNVTTGGSFPFAGAEVGAPLNVSRTFTVRGSMIIPVGRVIDERLDLPITNALVRISSPGLGLLCEAQTGIDYYQPDAYRVRVPGGGTTECRAEVDSVAPTTLVLVYEVTTESGVDVFTHTTPLAPLGGRRWVPQDLLVRTTALDLSGFVARPSGAPMLNTTVQVQVAGKTSTVRTNNEGMYRMGVILPYGVLSGTLQYRVTYRNVDVLETRPFSATLYEATPLETDLIYTPRTVYFRGDVTNDYNTETPLTIVAIQSDQIITALGTSCVTQTALDGTYVCVGTTRSVGAISVTYDLSGLWGSQRFSELATIDGSQDIVNHTRDIRIDLTVIHAYGRVSTPAGDPLRNVEIRISGDDVYRISPGQTNASGDYSFYVVMKPRGGGQLSGVLNYFIGYGEEGRIHNVDFSAQVNQATPLTKDFILNMRVVTFSGAVKNGWVAPNRSDSGIYGTRVVVTAPSIGYLCEYAVLDRYRQTSYSCSARIFTDQSFEVRYDLSGNWGTAILTDTVTHLPGPGSQITFAKDLTVRPTTVQLNGRVSDRDGQPIKEVKIIVDGSAFLPHYVDDRLEHTVSVTTDATGYYTAHAVLGQGLSATSLDYMVKYAFGDQTYALTKTASLETAPAELTILRANFAYPYRKVAFKGRLQNATSPNNRIKGTLLIVSPTVNRALCRIPAAGSEFIDTEKDYECAALVDSDEPLVLNYRVEGRFCRPGLGGSGCPIFRNQGFNDPFKYYGESNWGEFRLNNQTAPAGATMVVQDLPALPRVVSLNGTLTSSDGSPLPNASLTMTSYSIVHEGFVTVRAATNASGFYSTTVVLGADVTRISVRYAIQVNGISSIAEKNFELGVYDQRSTATNDIQISARNLVFRGSLVNSLLAGPGTWSSNNQLVIASPTLGRLCLINNLGGSYSCATQLASASPFDVVYTIYADWGTAVITDHIDLLPAPGQLGYWDKNLAVSPTMLRIQGQADYEADGEVGPLANTGITTAWPGIASSPLVSSLWRTASTNASGNFDVYVILRDTNQSLSGTLSLVFATSPRLPKTVHFTALEGQLNLVDMGSFTLVKPYIEPSTARTIILRGNFRNSLAPAIGEADTVAWYQLSSPTHGQICYYDENQGGPLKEYGIVRDNFNCVVVVDNAEPFEVTVNAWGPHGMAERVFEVTNIPAIGGSRTIFEDVQLTPTTFHLAGVIAQPNGPPIGLAQIAAKLKINGLVVGAASDVADQNGIYDLYINISPWLQGLIDVEYTITVDGIVTEYRLPNRSFRQRQINEVWQTWPFERRRVRFVGRVTNAFVPGLGVPGLMYITSPDFWSSQFCDAEMDVQTGYYTCDALLDDGDPIDINYRINGEWGLSDRTGVVTNVLGVGQTTLVERDFTVTPTTLHLQGTLTDPYGKRLANAAITVRGDYVGHTGQGGVRGFTVYTDAQGNYNAYIVLRPNVTQGDLEFEVAYYNIKQSFTRHFFGLNRNALNFSRQDLEISFRKAVFVGRARNTYAPGIGMLGDLTISNPSRGALCTAAIDDGSGHQYNPELYVGEYTCIAPGVTTDPFTVSYRLSGDWGSATWTDEIQFGTVGSVVTTTKDLPVSPTTLRLSGVIRDGVGTPLAGALIQVGGNNISASQPPLAIRTNAQGVYTGTIILKSGVPTGTLNYAITYGDSSGTALVPFAVPLDQLSVVTRDITFTERVVQLSGIVGNRLTGNRPLGSNRIQVTDAGGGELCAVSSLSNGSYSCTVRVLDMAAIPIRYHISGDWGSQTLAGSIPAGAAGSTTNVPQTLGVAPATLLLTGIVEDGTNQALSGATIALSSSGFSTTANSLSLVTTAQGTYSGTVVLKANSLAGTISYRVTYNGIAATIGGSYSAQAEQLTPVSQRIRFTTRNIDFGGQISNAFAPYMQLRNTQVQVSLPGGDQLCVAATNATGNYSCRAQVLSQSSLDVTYTASGDWGTLVVSGTIPPGSVGSTSSVARSLEARPTTVLLRGVIRESSDAPLAGATVEVASNSLSNAVPSASITSNAQGAYDGAVILKAGITHPTLRYQVAYAAAEMTLEEQKVVALNALTPVNQDFRFTNRSLDMRGVIHNTLVPSATLAQTQVRISTPNHPNACSPQTNALGQYVCQTSISDSGTFVATINVSGDWGTRSFTQSVTMGALGSLTTISRDFGVAPTTLRLTGRVHDGASNPISNASVAVSTAGASNANAGTTALSDAQGAYTLTLILRNGVTSGNLHYAVSYSAGQATLDTTFSAAAQALTPISRDISFTARTVTWSGRVINRLTGQGVNSTQVAISTPASGTLCTPTTWSDGSYSCSRQVFESGSFVGTYSLSGGWGSDVITATVPAGAPGSTTALPKNLLIAPTTLLVNGYVRDGQSAPLVGATVTIESTLLHGSETVALSTNAQGFYSATLVLKSGVSSGVLSYRVNYQGIQSTESVNFSAAASQLTPISRNLTLSSRTVAFSGRVLNSLYPQMNIANTQVIIRSSSLGRLCSVATTSSGYSCNVQVFDTESLAILYDLSGDWGTATVTGTVAPGATGTTTAAVNNLLVAPTTLLLTGSVRDGIDAPLSGATVRIESARLLAPGFVETTTNATGAYTVPAGLKLNESQGALSYRVVHNGVTLNDTATFTASAGALTTVSKNFTISNRQITFTGYVRNTLAENARLNSNSVAISAAGTGALCSDTYLYDPWYGYYTYYDCAATVQNSAAFSVTYTIQGDWGTAIVTGTVPAGGSQTVNYDLGVQPTTVRLAGVVQDSAGRRLANAGTSAQGSIFSTYNLQTDTTDTNGEYSFYGVLRNTITTATLDLIVNLNSELRQAIVVAAPANALTTITRTVTFDLRTVQFYGYVKNNLVPDWNIQANQIQVRDSQGNQLCQANVYWYNSYYSCSATVLTTAPFSVTYAIYGDWGLLLNAATAPAGTVGSATSFSRDLTISPTTVRLAGTVTDQDGTPAPSVSLSTSGTMLSGNSVNLQSTSTNASGEYVMHAIVRSGFTSGTLNLHYSRNSMDFTAPIAVDVISGTLNVITTGLVFDKRRTNLTGSIRNGYAASLLLPVDTVAVGVPEQGVLCSNAWNGSTSYSCTGFITTTQAISVSYRPAGAWGTQTVTGTIPAGAGSTAINVPFDLLVYPTTLHLTGTIRSYDGSALAGAYVQISAPELLNPVSGYTDAQGHYSFYVTARANAASTTLRYSVQANGTTIDASRSVTLIQRQLNPVSHDLGAQERLIFFQGRIRNSNADNQLLADFGRTQITLQRDATTLCSTTTYQFSGSYSCSAVISATGTFEPFDVRYALNGPWGSQTVSATLDPGTLNGSFVRDITVAPTTLRISGIVRNAGNNPILSTYVDVSGPGVHNPVGGYTDDNGRYTLDLILAEGQTAADLSLLVGGEVYATRVAPLTLNALNTHSFDINSAPTIGRLIQTVSGNGSAGMAGDNGQATNARHYYPRDVAFGPDGSFYVADSSNYRVRKIAPNGVITTVAGNGYSGNSGDGGPATSASLYPYSIAVGPDGSIYIADYNSHRIRRIAPDGIITTVAGTTGGYSGDGGLATTAQLYSPSGIAVGPDGSVYVADYSNQRIRRIAPDGIITTVAGTASAGYLGDGGLATAARLYYPSGVAVGADGSLFIADTSNRRIRKVAPNGIISTIAGTGTSGYTGDGGPATSARLANPIDVVTGPDGSLYLTDSSYGVIRRVSPSGAISTVAGSGTNGYAGDGGSATAARLSSPQGLGVGADGRIAVADYSNQRIRSLFAPGVIFSGSVVDSQGAPLSGVSVSASSWSLQRSVSTSTNAQGRYSAYGQLIITQPQTVTFTMQASVGNTWLSQSVERFVTPLTFQQITVPFTLDNRLIAFSGILSNTLVGKPLQGPPSLVEVRRGAEVLCRVTTSHEGVYGCPQIQATAQAFAVTYVVSGTWGSATTDATIPAGAIGSYLSPNQPINVTPTMLRLSGTIRNASNDPVNGVLVQAGGADVFQMGQGTSAGAGRYSVDVVLRANISAVALQYQLSGSGIQLESAANFSDLDLNTLNQRTYDFTPIGFRGQVTNTALAGAAVGDYGHTQVVIKTGTTTLCETTTFSSFGSYLCPGHNLTSTLPLNLQYTVSGSWGSAVYTSVVTATDPGGMYAYDLAIAPTTLRLQGTVNAADGTPQANALIQVTGAGLHLPLSGYADEAGDYRIEGLLRVGVVSPLLNITVGGAFQPLNLAGLTPNALNERTVALTSTYAVNHVIDTRPFTSTVVALAAGLDGSSYLFDSTNTQILRLAPDGSQTVIAGNGQYGDGGDGGPALAAQLANVRDLALGPDGSLYVAAGYRVRRITPNGLIFTVAGNGQYGFSGDGGPALNASFTYLEGLAFGPDGSLYLADTSNRRIRRIAPDGIVTTVAGDGGYSFDGDDQPATEAALYYPYGVAIAADGTMYIADRYNQRIRQVAPDGNITTLVGNGDYGYNGEGLAGSETTLADPNDVVLGPDGSLYISDTYNYRVRRLTPAGVVHTVAGDGRSYPGGGGGDWRIMSADYPHNDGIPAIAAAVQPQSLAIAGDGALLIGDSQTSGIRRVGAPQVVLAGRTLDPAGVPVESVTVEAHSARLAHPYRTQSAENGRYAIYPWIMQPITGTLSLVAKLDTAIVSKTVSINLHPHIPSVADHDIILDGRTIVLEGSVINQFSGGSLGGVETAVAVRIAGEEVCATAATSGYYSCAEINLPTAATQAEYTYSGEWGTAAVTATIAAGDLGSFEYIYTYLPVTMTTLEVSGTIRSATGEPVQDATIEVVSADPYADIEGYSDEQGRYVITATLNPVATTRLTFTVATDDGLLVDSAVFSDLTPLALNQRTHAIGGLGIQGQVRHAGIPQLVLDDNQQTTIAIKLNAGEYCTTATGRSGSFACPVNHQAAVGELQIQYTLDGPWGSQVVEIVTSTLQHLTFNHDLAISPTTLELSGTLSSSAGITLTNYPVRLAGDDVYLTTHGYTDQAGRYRLYAILRADHGSTPAVNLLAGGEIFTPSVGLLTANSVNQRTFDATDLPASGAVINTLAGNGTYGSSGDGGPAPAAQLGSPVGLAIDQAGRVYIADRSTQHIRRIDATGVITTVAGMNAYGSSGDGGPAAAAGFSQLNALAFGNDGSLYIADYTRLRRIDPNGIITSPVIGYSLIAGLAIGSDDSVYFSRDNQVYRMSRNSRITLVAGTGYYGFAGDGGPAIAATLAQPSGLGFDSLGNLYIADRDNHRIRRIDAAGIITTVAGTGSYGFAGDGGLATEARLAGPYNLAVGRDGSVYINDYSNYRVRRVTPDGLIHTVAGNGSYGFAGDGGDPAQARISAYIGLAVAPDGRLYLGDSDNRRVRLVDQPPSSAGKPEPTASRPLQLLASRDPAPSGRGR